MEDRERVAWRGRAEGSSEDVEKALRDSSSSSSSSTSTTSWLASPPKWFVSLTWYLYCVTLFYGSGGSALVCTVTNLTVGLPRARDSWFWVLTFPTHTVLSGWSPSLWLDAAPEDRRGVLDLTVFPYFNDAIPFYFLAVALDALLHRWLRRGGHSFEWSTASIVSGTLDETVGCLTNPFVFSVYRYVHDHFALWRAPVEDDLSLAWWVGFLGIDFLYFLAHYAFHHINAFWSWHSVHHSSPELTIATGLRQPITGAIDTLGFYLPLALLLPPRMIQAHSIVTLMYQFWLHSSLVPKLWGPVEFVFNTPSHHRVHHARNPEFLDKNFAGVFILWDRLFGTFAEEPDEDPCAGSNGLVYGLIPPLDSLDPLETQFHVWRSVLKRAWEAPWPQGWWYLVVAPGTTLRPHADSAAVAWERRSAPPLGSRLNPLLQPPFPSSPVFASLSLPSPAGSFDGLAASDCVTSQDGTRISPLDSTTHSSATRLVAHIASARGAGAAFLRGASHRQFACAESALAYSLVQVAGLLVWFTVLEYSEFVVAHWRLEHWVFLPVLVASAWVLARVQERHRAAATLELARLGAGFVTSGAAALACGSALSRADRFPSLHPAWVALWCAGSLAAWVGLTRPVLRDRKSLD